MNEAGGVKRATCEEEATRVRPRGRWANQAVRDASRRVAAKDSVHLQRRQRAAVCRHQLTRMPELANLGTVQLQAIDPFDELRRGDSTVFA